MTENKLITNKPRSCFVWRKIEKRQLQLFSKRVLRYRNNRRIQADYIGQLLHISVVRWNHVQQYQWVRTVMRKTIKWRKPKEPLSVCDNGLPVAGGMCGKQKRKRHISNFSKLEDAIFRWVKTCLVILSKKAIFYITNCGSLGQKESSRQIIAVKLSLYYAIVEKQYILPGISCTTISKSAYEWDFLLWAILRQETSKSASRGPYR